MVKRCSKIINTDRLIITPFSEKHITPRYVGWLNDPELMCYSEQRHKIHTLESCTQYWHSFFNTPNILWAIEVKANGFGHIGNINAYIDQNNKVADVGILIGETDVHGYGYGYEAFKSVSEYLFVNIGIRKLTAGTVSVNSSMIRLMQRMKMSEDGVRKRHYLMNKDEVDIIHMALFKEEMLQGNNRK